MSHQMIDLAIKNSIIIIENKPHKGVDDYITQST